MAPAKKSKIVNKRFLNVNEEYPGKDGGSGNKTKQRKKKLSDMLGSQWSKEELVRFYEAYRKYGKEWKKVAAAVHSRSVEVVEALYNMNKAYLSLPEGTASVFGLIAMMTDHYNILEGSDSDQESNGDDESVISQKPQNCARGKFRLNVSKPDESSVQFKEGKRTLDIVDKLTISKAMSVNQEREKAKTTAARERGHQSTVGVEVTVQKGAQMGRDSGLSVSALSKGMQPAFQSTPRMGIRKFKSLASKSPKFEVHTEPFVNEHPKAEALAEEGKKSICIAKHTNQIVPPPKQGESVRPAESSCCTDAQKTPDSAASYRQVPTVNPVNVPTKIRSRQEMQKELKSSENVGIDQSTEKNAPPLHGKALDLKEMLSHCLSSDLLRRWCAYEWIYSAVDYPWFAKREFLECLNHVGLGHIPRLTRVEWGVIRSSLGKPRRLSQKFLREEKVKLQQYRESVRAHYTELHAGVREGLPTDLAWPLSVGQHVVACHPRTREIHNGSILTVDQSRCRVQFDRPELGIEFVMDIDCMPLNPLENMPETLRKQRITFDKFHENFHDHELSQSSDCKEGGHMKFASSEQGNMNGPPCISSSSYPMNTLLKQGKVDTVNGISQAKAAASKIVNAQEATYTERCTLAQSQAREADVQALFELNHALHKKEALVMELRHMNDEVERNLKDEENFLMDPEPFKKQHAMLLLQLQAANNQVSSAMLYLRQRNTYPRKP